MEYFRVAGLLQVTVDGRGLTTLVSVDVAADTGAGVSIHSDLDLNKSMATLARELTCIYVCVHLSRASFPLQPCGCKPAGGPAAVKQILILPSVPLLLLRLHPGNELKERASEQRRPHYKEEGVSINYRGQGVVTG
ncbi:hypothetical protein J6590_028808 [Homalodisca vitripennis]|nr:hypothetical protein J6590_028808 [Homalodisca vitripennis]